MDPEAVTEFLARVPLLQRLPSSSLRKIAQLVTVKHYECGDCIVRDGEAGDGVYFIWDGEAEVSREENDDDDEIRAEFQLRRYDYFGHGIAASTQHADVIASSKVICLVLPHEYCDILRSKSIWSADGTFETCPFLERTLHLEPLEANIFWGITSPDAPKWGNVIGGQFMGQALVAASKTVDCLKFAYSLQAHFLFIGDVDLPIIYQVHRVRDGNNFATRKVDALQKGNVIFTMFASFQKEEEGFDHQDATMPSVPEPEMLLSMEELRERRLTDPRFPRTYRHKVATAKFVPWPIEIRFCEHNTSTNQTKSPPSLMYWFRAREKLPDDQALHQCVVALASDIIFIQVSINSHRKRGLKTIYFSLDHSIWFHRPCRADDWLLFMIESPSAHGARGFCSGRMFNRKGELLVSLAQGGLIRRPRTPKSAVKSKL